MYFRNEYAFLSNMYECSIKFKGITYRNAEACFQAQKDLSRSKEFSNLDGYTAKKLGRRVKLRSDWQQVKVDLMFRIVYEKFRSNLVLQYKLIATGDIELVEDNTWNDTFWGRCNGVGENMLGKILMDVRDMFNSDPSDKRSLKQMNSLNSNIQNEKELSNMKMQIKVFHIGPKEERTTIRTTKSGKQFNVRNIEGMDVLAGLKGNDFRKKKFKYIFDSDITEFHFNGDSTDYMVVAGVNNATEYRDTVYQEYLYNKKYIQTAQMNRNAVVYINGQKVWTSREPFYLLEYIMNDRQVTRANSVRDDKTAKLRKACKEVGATFEELNRTYLEMEQFVEMYASMYEVTPRTKKLLTITDEFRNTGAGHSASWAVKHNVVRDVDVLADITEVYYNIIALQHLGFEPDHTKYARCPHCGSWYSLSAPHRPGRCRNCETIETREDFMDSVIDFDVEFRDWQYDADDYDSEF